MTKFNPKVAAPVQRMQTHEGADAFRAPTMKELAFTAACTFAGETTFYESADARMQRLIDLVQQAAWKNPREIAQFVHDLRTKYMIRSASILVAAEYARALQQTGYPDNADSVRSVIDAACQRADEPAELIAYWQSNYGHDRSGRRKASLPQGVRKGLADAARRLFTPQAALKWNSHERQIRMGDVLELVHPDPATEEQSALFRLILDERHRGAWESDHDMNRVALAQVPAIQERLALGRYPENARRQLLERDPQRLWRAGFTWEHLSSWVPGGMDAKAWEAIIPRMGVMALLRNLRNFDQAGISEKMVDFVISKITSEEDVLASRILPFRTYTAYVNAPSDNWKRALGKTLQLASASAPRFDDSLLMIDMSGSMTQHMSAKSQVQYVQLAALQAMTVAKHSKNVDVVVFAENSMNIDQMGERYAGGGWYSHRHPAPTVAPNQAWREKSILSQVEWINANVGIVGGATYGHKAIQAHFNPQKHKHVLLFTDGQMWDGDTSRHVPSIITFNLAGYAALSTWGKGRINVAGWSDTVFQVVSEIVND